MKNEELENVSGLNFDLFDPPTGHQQRFLEKLSRGPKRTSKKVRYLWVYLSGMAAILITALLLSNQFFQDIGSPMESDLAEVSPQLKQTQNFYNSVIKKELESLEGLRDAETEQVINDAMRHMEILEKEYTKLKKDLLTSGQDKRVIYAMITNFQQRTDLLKQVLDQIQTLKELKNQDNETNLI